MRALPVARLRVLVRAFAATAAFALVFASWGAAVAEVDSDGDGVSDSIEQATQRNVAAVVSRDEFSITSRLERAGLQDQFDISYRAGTFTVRYENPRGVTSGYELEFRNLVEWVDLNENGRIDDGSEVIGRTALGSSAFGDIPVSRSNSTNADGGRMLNFIVRSKADEVTLNLTVAQRFVRLASNRVLTPMEMKMDIAISHLLLQAGTRVGIELRFDSEQAVEYGNRSWDEIHGFTEGEGAMSVTGGPSDREAIAFFSWSKTALAEDVPIPANLTTWERESGSYDMYLAYPIAYPPQTRVTILHDPSLGVESAVYAHVVNTPPELQADIVLYAGSLTAMVLLVAITIVFANRRRGKREE